MMKNHVGGLKMTNEVPKKMPPRICSFEPWTAPWTLTLTGSKLPSEICICASVRAEIMFIWAPESTIASIVADDMATLGEVLVGGASPSVE